MAPITLVNQLFQKPVEEEEKHLIEHPKYFKDRDFHKQKLILHRASMKAYSEKINGEYIESSEASEKLEEIFRGSEEVNMYDPVDHEIRESFEDLAEEFDTELKFLKSPGFFVSRSWNKNYF